MLRGLKSRNNLTLPSTLLFEIKKVSGLILRGKNKFKKSCAAKIKTSMWNTLGRKTYKYVYIKYGIQGRDGNPSKSCDHPLPNEFGDAVGPN